MKRSQLVMLVVTGIVAIGALISLVILPRLDIFDHSVVFDASGTDLIKLSNPYYELGLSKNNGAIVYITDKATGQHITDGDRDGNLWMVTFSDSILSSTYSPAGPSQFTYAWSSSARQLSLNYSPNLKNENHINVTVHIAATKGKGFDMQLEMQNNWGYPPSEIRFPADLIFNKADIKEALLPILPGVVLDPGFFIQGIRYETTYPGNPGTFADFMALSSARGSFALYSKAVDGKNQIVPAFFGFYFSPCVKESTCLTHNYRATPLNKSTWMSPVVRIRVSETRLETIAKFREDDGLASDPSLRTKLGALYDRFVQMPMYKADAMQLAIKFSDYPALLSKIPYPGLLHPVGYMPGGHDHSYPDFIPPDPQWGSTQDLAAMFKQAQAMGFLVMPYINPTWWDGNSATLQKLPANTVITHISAMNANGGEYEECYGCPNSPRYGYAVSPYASFVQKRLAQVMDQMKKEVPSDLIFEDQIGVRTTLFDTNTASPSLDAYTQGWFEHTKKYADARLMTEGGFDRLAETEVGFDGSVLLSERIFQTDMWWGNHNWHVYPLAALAAGDKVFLYQHDLAPESFTQNKATLAWNAAMGYMLSYDLNPSQGLGGGVDDEFIKVVSDFQKFVFSSYLGERMMDYADLGPKLTLSSFDKVEVTTNWDTKNEAPLGGYTLAPSGFIVQRKDGSLIAGLFTQYNGKPLSGDPHYLIEERQAKQIIVHQPLGTTTDLTLSSLSGWGTGTLLVAEAHSADGHAIGTASVTVAGKEITFNYQKAMSSKLVAYYVIKPKD